MGSSECFGAGFVMLERGLVGLEMVVDDTRVISGEIGLGMFFFVLLD